MRLKKPKIIISFILSLFVMYGGITASALNNNSPPGTENCSVSIPFKVNDSKSSIPKGTVFTVTITALKNAPLPEKTSYEVNVSGQFEFGPIVFSEPGDYEYIVRETAADSDDIIYDGSVYRVRASVIWNDDGKLIGGYAVLKEGSETKPDSLEFDNIYADGTDASSTVSDDSSDDSDNSDGSSDGGSPFDNILPPQTGGAVAIGSSGVLLISLAVILAKRRKTDVDEKPPDKGSG